MTLTHKLVMKCTYIFAKLHDTDTQASNEVSLRMHDTDTQASNEVYH